MAFIQIRSNNPNISYILEKNPSSGLYVRNLHKGNVFGYYSDEHTYNVYFKDALNEISYPEYKDQEFEYINVTRYSSSQFILNIIGDMFRTPYKKQNDFDLDDTYESSITMNMVRLDNHRILKSFVKHLPNIDFQIDEINYKFYRITLSTMRSIHYLLNVLSLFSCFNVLKNKTEYIHLDPNTIEKYIASLSIIDAPYFIRYQFKTDLLRSPKTYAKYKNILENSSHYPIKLEFGTTTHMRFDAVAPMLSPSHHIVDVGCGEGQGLLFFKNRLQNINYYAIDPDEMCQHAIKNKKRKYNLPNVYVFDYLTSFFNETTLPQDSKFDFMLCEVIEHMSIEDATLLVKQCLDFNQRGNVIITTPNKNFNTFYFDDDERDYRHPDHKFEFTYDEFVQWVHDIKGTRQVGIFPIGDVVNNIPVSLGACFYEN